MIYPPSGQLLVDRRSDRDVQGLSKRLQSFRDRLERFPGAPDLGFGGVRRARQAFQVIPNGVHLTLRHVGECIHLRTIVSRGKERTCLVRIGRTEQRVAVDQGPVEKR